MKDPFREKNAMEKGRRGFSLGSVLLLGLVLTVLMLGLTRVSVGHLWLTTHSNSTLRASSMVNSAASAAIAKLLEKSNYGATDPDIVLERNQARAIVTFSQERAEGMGIPYSTNNLDGTVAKEGFGGRSVAPATALVIATCTLGGSQRTVEAVLKLPPFPWAILSGGTLQTREKVVIGSIPKGLWPPPPDDELLPADILANAGSRRAIVLDGQCWVHGDVESPGGIVLEGRGVQVKGEVRPGVAPIEVPQLRAAQYDPVSMGLDYDDLEGLDPSATTVPIQGAARKQGDFEVNAIRLEGANLFVDGNLTVRGSITGTGTVICTGNVDLKGVTLEAATDLAVLADGRIDLRGTDSAASAVRGLFYAGEGMSARDLTVVGTVVAGRSFGEVELENARVLLEPRPESSPTPSDTAYIGEATLLPAGQTGPAPANLTKISFDRPAYPYGFSLKVTHANPQTPYPVTVTVGPGFVLSGTRTFTLRNERDIQGMINFFSQSFQGGRLDPPMNRVVSLPRISTVSFFQNLISRAISPAGWQSSNPAIDLEGDFSRFLPFESRVRVVSWLEG